MKLKIGDIINFLDKNYVILNYIEYKKEPYYLISECFEKFELKEPNILMVKNNNNSNDDNYDLAIIKDQKQIENVLKEIKV